jgi:hypothetical protein
LEDEGESLGGRCKVKRIGLYCLVLAVILYSATAHALKKGYPHLQIFLTSADLNGGASFIAFWDADHQLAAGPFPIRLLELTGLDVLLELSYAEPKEEVPSRARLRIYQPTASHPKDRKRPAILVEVSDRIAGLGVSRMFPDAPFIVIGHRASSTGVVQVGNVMKEIQNKILACDKNYRELLETILNSLKESASYDHAQRTMELSFPPCS